VAIDNYQVRIYLIAVGTKVVLIDISEAVEGQKLTGRDYRRVRRKEQPEKPVRRL